MIYMDQYYLIFVVPTLLLALYAQFKVKSTYAKYAKIASKKGLSGQAVVRAMLLSSNITSVKTEFIAGNLTDHFDPKANVVRLSEGVYEGTSVSAIGIAAHEAGHALQHHMGYMPIKMRNAVLPVAQIGTHAAFPLAILGIVLGYGSLIDIGILLFAGVVVFQFVTLPVEINASRRAIAALESNHILQDDELLGAKKVLSAAALTYIAAAAVAFANLLRLVLLRQSSRR